MSERRRYTRFSKVKGLDVILKFHTAGDSGQLPVMSDIRARLVNLSGGGGFVETEKVEGLMGAVCTLSMPISGDVAPLELDGRVVRVSPRAGSNVGLGLSFLTREELEADTGERRRSNQMERLSSYIVESHGLSSIPKVVQNIMRVAASPDSSSKDLAYELGTYPALRERLLEVVRSKIFNLPGETKSIQDAVRMLGFRQISNVAITLAASNLFGDEMEEVPISRGFWHHSLACANISEMIAGQVEKPVASPYVAGLLHDLGKLVLLFTFRAEYQRLKEALQSGDAMVHAMERHLVGLPHDEVNLLLAKKLRFGEELARPLCQHHTTDMPPDNTTAVVHLADVMCHSMGLVFPRGGRRPKVNRLAIELLDLSNSEMSGLQLRAHEVVDRVDMWAALL
jgi:HD-like signal output (HDOD) protein